MLLREYLPALRYGAKILPFEVLGGGSGGSSAPFIGNVYYVMHSTDSWYGNFYADYYCKYTDGTASIYNTIQTAVDAATSDRGDVIIVTPGKWKEDVVIVEKDGLRILGCGFGTGGTDYGAPRMRPSDATTKYPYTTTLGSACQSAGFHILSRNVELAGFYLDGGGGYGGVYLGGGLYGGVTGYDDETASGAWIHNNYFRGGSEGLVGLFMDGAKFGCIIENNIFERWTGAGIELGPGNASNECCIIRNNTFTADNGGYGIDIYGAANSALGLQVNSNFFGDRASHAFTYALNNRASSSGVLCSMDNHFACANAQVLVATDFTSGNSAQHAGSATTGNNLYMEESAAGV